MIRKALVISSLIAVALISNPIDAQAKPQSFHIKHSNYSLVNGGVQVFTGSACQPKTLRKRLHRGQKVTQNGYDSFTVPGREFSVTVYSNTTGKEIKYTHYAGGRCIRAWNNDYSVRMYDRN